MDGIRPAPAAGEPTQAPAGSRRLDDDAKAAIASGDLGKAEVLLRELVTARPEAERAWHRLGVVLSRGTGIADAARRLGDLAEHGSPSAAGARVAARMAAQARDLDLALRLARLAAERDGFERSSAALLCRLLMRLGRPQEAAAAARRAIDRGMVDSVLDIATLMELAEILFAVGEHAAAHQAVQAVIGVDPARERAYLLAADSAAGLGDDAREEAALRSWMAAFPAALPPRHRLVNFLVNRGRPAEAAPLLLRILRERPDDGRFYTLAAMVMSALEKDRRARTLAERGVALLPGSSHAQVALATILSRLGRYEDAEGPARAAVALAPDLVEGHNLLALSLQRQNRFAEAIVASERALALAPEDADALANLATLEWTQEHYEKSLATFGRALAIRPDDPEIHFNRALTHLALGRLTEAWADFGYRWRRRKMRRRPFPAPWWDGRPVDGKLLIWGEQGIGDEVLAAGLLRDAERRARGLIVESDRRLTPVLRRSFPGIEAVPRSDPPDPATRADDVLFQRPMVDLPIFLRRTPRSFRPHRGYLLPDPERAAELRARYRAGGGRPVVGLSWHSTNPKFGARKSLELLGWAPLLRVPGITFVSLQYGDCTAEVAAARAETGAEIIVDPEIDSLTDIDGFVAQVAAMDLVVSISNSTAHFAGAVGRPCWLLLARGNGLLWYWLMCRDDRCPWYPSMRVFRQDREGEWSGMIGRVAAELAATAGKLA
ncbi:MAG: tetratricopeptide repeat protein [Alphaproteobacteria bacterium]